MRGDENNPTKIFLCNSFEFIRFIRLIQIQRYIQSLDGESAVEQCKQIIESTCVSMEKINRMWWLIIKKLLRNIDQI